jgi:hypothetical protein
LGQGAGHPGFSDAGGAGDQDIVVRAQPLAGGELRKQRLVEPARVAIVDVLDGRLMAQPGLAPPCGEPAALAPTEFAVHEQPQALLGRERLDARGLQLFLEGFRHTREA